MKKYVIITKNFEREERESCDVGEIKKRRIAQDDFCIIFNVINGIWVTVDG